MDGSCNAGVVDEFHLALAPVFLGSGLPVFQGVDPLRIRPELIETVPSPRVTHLRYRVESTHGPGGGPPG